jgi:hypothetical protein
LHQNGSAAFPKSPSHHLQNSSAGWLSIPPLKLAQSRNAAIPESGICGVRPASALLLKSIVTIEARLNPLSEQIEVVAGKVEANAQRVAARPESHSGGIAQI